MSGSRVALLGLSLESNRLSPTATEAEFIGRNWFEVDIVGLTSTVLERFDWKGLPRPVYPLDDDAAWQPSHGVAAIP